MVDDILINSLFQKVRFSEYKLPVAPFSTQNAVASVAHA